MSGDDKGAGGGEDGSTGDVMDKNNGVRGGEGVKGVGVGDTSSESIGDMGAHQCLYSVMCRLRTYGSQYKTLGC